MNAVRRMINSFRDSPTYGRDRATLISGLTVGTTALLLNGAVLMLVMPLMLDPDDRDFRTITENLEFGQLLALILLGGAAGFATVLIPLRIVTVFWGPRVGRYFDQVVLSGISPFRYVIGKATSQNLFLALILFLLLPYLVLSLTLGGVKLEFFLAGLFLVWLYCMLLAVVTLWISLYVNELIAAGLVISGAVTLSILGCIPFPVQPFVVTPFPALIHPVYSSIPFLTGSLQSDFFSVFISCALCMTALIGISLFAISLGPLYGIIRENSTFGEVVRAGDSKRKRWLRLRLHIQRPSELAFFYENRSQTFRRNEGLIRWGIGFGGLTLLAAGVYAYTLYIVKTFVANWGGTRQWWIYDFHVSYLTIHGIALALAIFLFSHAKNTTCQSLPFFRGKHIQVGRLDTWAFLLFLVISSAMCIGSPFWFEEYVAKLGGNTVFPTGDFAVPNRPVDFMRSAFEGTAVLSIAALALYAVHRYLCMRTWTRVASFLIVGVLYFFGVCLLPVFIAAMFLDMPELRRMQMLSEAAPWLGIVSPVMAIVYLFNELGPRFPRTVTLAPFYSVHAALIGLSVLGIRRRERKLREEYLSEQPQETN